MKHSNETGKKPSEWTKREALEILCECKMLRWTVAALEEKALKVLKRPELRVIDGGKCKHEWVELPENQFHEYCVDCREVRERE